MIGLTLFCLLAFSAAQTVRPCDRECPYGEHCESDGKDEVCAPDSGDPNPIPTRDPNEPTTAPHLICPHGCLIGQHCDITENGAECVSDPPIPGGPCGGFPCFTDTTTVKSEVDLPVTPIIEPIPTCAMAGLCIDGASCIDTPTGPVCAPKCSDNEEVNHCGNLCENKCASLCQPQACLKICGPPKCACKKDRYRDPKSGKCVKEKQCPKCPTTGGYPTGGTKAPPVCNILCEIGTHCEVKPTGPICVPDDKNCPKHSTYSQCGNHCEGKCATAFSGPQLCSFVCGPAACACDKDYYRNDDNKCVTKDECNNNGCGPNTEPVNPCAFTTCLAPSDCIVVDGNAKCVAPGTASGHPYA